MIKIIKELNIDVTKPNVFQAVVAKQYDMNSRFLKVTLTDCGSVVQIPYSDNIKAVISAERVDGQSKGFDGEVNEDGTLTVPLHSWMLELDGLVTCDISVIEITENDNKKLTTTSFDLMVEKAAYGGEDVTTDPQYDVLIELIERVENIEKSVADKTYDPTSENAQSGIAVAEAIEGLGNSWEKIVDITTTEEVNGIMATVEEFTDLENCKEFVFRVVFPKSPTGEDLVLGASRIDFNTNNQIIFRFSSTTVSKSAICEHRCHCVIADKLIQSIGTYQPIGHSVVTGGMQMLVGNWVAPSVINNIYYYLNDANNFLPIGTQLVIYGKKIEIGESVESIINEKLGDIETALVELHNYAQALINGGAE